MNSNKIKTTIDIQDFNDRILRYYNEGTAEYGLEADESVARSLVPAGTGAARDFSYVAPEIPQFDADKCVGCMECVTQCPDTAILGKAIPEADLETQFGYQKNSTHTKWIKEQWAVNKKFYDTPKRQNKAPAKFGIFVDPEKCKGCGECVLACGEHNALKMVVKEKDTVPKCNAGMDFFKGLGPTPDEYINERVLADMMLAEEALLFTGGAGSCMGCGEATALRMMLAATGFVYGRESIGLAAATGCNTVYGATYPYNPFLVPWSNSLFENVAAFAMGIRMRWDQKGWQDKKLWAIGGDGAMLDIGFQSMSRLFMSGMDINILILDTQVYSNTGGQASTGSFRGQSAQMSSIGKVKHGKSEPRKEIANIAMAHPDVFVAQTTAAHPNHFYKSVMAANAYPGPSVINVYTSCQPEHGIADDRSYHQAKLAVDCRVFPIFQYDPQKGKRIIDRLSLQGNPAKKEDWYSDPRSGEAYNFIRFARTENRFAHNFDKDGTPLSVLFETQKERLQNWNFLQELAGFI